jgi:hyaluronan synthase
LKKPSLFQELESPKSQQKILSNGKIGVAKKGWVLRIATLAIHLFLIIYIIYEGIRIGDSFIIYSFLMPLSTFLNLLFGWIFYKNPASKYSGENNELVSVIVPVYNQESMVEQVIDSLFQSTHKNIEVVVVNDGSKDKTKEVLDRIAASKKYDGLQIIHNENGGKRKAVATGFYNSKGKIVVLIDSDSIVDRYAITEFVKAFSADPRIGGAVGHVKIVNSGKNFLTKFQDAWYDFSFNVGKSSESVFGTVTCISGCLAAYRREAIEHFVPYWAGNPINRWGDDKELTIYTVAPPSTKTELRSIFGDKFWVPLSQKLMESMAKYDDAEDRGLTAHSMLSWKSVFVASALVYTDAPENWKQFNKQQIRWKKGFLRTNFFVNSFFWKKHPLIAFKYYIEFISTIIAPMVNFVTFFYVPFILGNWSWTVTVLGISLVAGFAQGLDYKFRDPGAKYWMYKPFAVLVTYHWLSWLIFPAIWTFKKNVWGTR